MTGGLGHHSPWGCDLQVCVGDTRNTPDSTGRTGDQASHLVDGTQVGRSTMFAAMKTLQENTRIKNCSHCTTEHTVGHEIVTQYLTSAYKRSQGLCEVFENRTSKFVLTCSRSVYLGNAECSCFSIQSKYCVQSHVTRGTSTLTNNTAMWWALFIAFHLQILFRVKCFPIHVILAIYVQSITTTRYLDYLFRLWLFVETTNSKSEDPMHVHSYGCMYI